MGLLTGLYLLSRVVLELPFHLPLFLLVKHMTCRTNAFLITRKSLAILPRYHAERSHEIASACAKQCNACRPTVQFI